MQSRIPVAFAFSLIACADNGNGGDEVVQCETGWFAETGGDYGTPWIPPEIPADSGNPLLDMGSGDTGMTFPDMPIEIRPDLVTAPPDDQDERFGWVFDVDSGTYYREATPLEALENRLGDPALLLIVPNFNSDIDITLPRVSIGLPVPMPGSPSGHFEVVNFRFDYVGETPPVVRLERGPTTSDVPTRWSRLPFYATASRAGTSTVAEGQTIGRLVVAPDGHASIRAAAGQYRLTMSGPISLDFTEVASPSEVFGSPVYKLVWERVGESESFDLILPPAANDIVSPLAGHQCMDSWDNDGDGVGDQCDYECVPHEDYAGPPGVTPIYSYEATKSLGLFGDLLYCASNQGWDAELVGIGMEAVQLLNWVDQGAESQDQNPPFRLVNIACDVRTSNVAGACHGSGIVVDGGDCPGDLADYPLASALNDFYYNYLPNVWDLVDWYVDGEEAVPMHVAVVVADQDGIDWFPQGDQQPAEDPDSDLAGLAFFIFQPEMLEDYESEGAAVINVHRYGGYINIAHETGHTMGLPHDTGEYAPVEWYHVPGLMNLGVAGSAPFLGPVHPLEVDSWWGTNIGFVDKTPPEVWQEYVRGKSWPRPSGFGYTGDG